ncbi:MAG: tetratricopeptide repeat protein [Gaiellaceae bacterium]
MLATWGAEGRLLLLRNVAASLAVGVSVFLLSYTNGGFDTTTRAYAAIAAWWLIGVGAALTLSTAHARASRLAVAAPALLGLYAVWILISMSWSPDGERTFAQFNQVSLYVAVLVLAIALARVVPVTWLVGGMSVALAAIAVVALVSRLFPSTFPGSTSQAAILNPLAVRLSFPLGYWNGLGIEVALALPLLLAIMVSRRSRLASALAALPLPVIAADMYFTSSRGAFVAAAVAIVAYLLLTASRWTALAAAAVTCASAACVVYVIHSRRELVNGQTYTAAGDHQGHVVALAVGLIAIVTALVWLGAGELARRLPTPPRLAGWATAGALVLAAIVLIAAAHPVRRFQEFKTPAHLTGSSNFVTSHLLSSSGSGRWQLWSAAVSEFKAHPLNGGGAGSYEYYWLQHRPSFLSYLFSQYGHSLYLETLAELGIVGLLLLLGAVLVAVGGAVRASILLRSTEVAAVTACGIAFFVAAAYDWIWQLGGIALVGVAALGFALGTLPSTRAAPWGRLSFVRPALALLAVAAIVPQVAILAVGLHLRNSQIADDQGNFVRAKSEALAAKTVEPWAATPYLQIALIDEQEGRPNEAKLFFEAAIRRSHDYWRLWAYESALDVRRAATLEARQELREARRLNPLEPSIGAGTP